MTDSFDTLYLQARSRLLLQCFALTGDRRAAELGVRDAFVRAGQHWRRVSTLEDPEEWVRAQAWSIARRRSQARVLHRERVDDEQHAATLDALRGLSRVQRDVLLLTTLTSSTLPTIARELNLSQPDVERELQAGTAQFALSAECDSAEVRDRILALESEIADARWPRPRAIQRDGTRRRRGYTVAGVMVTVAALVGAGAVVTADTGGTRPLAARAHQAQGEPTERGAEIAQPKLPSVGERHLLSDSEVARLAPARRWDSLPVTDRTGGRGIRFPCLPQEAGESGAEGLLVRKFRTADAQGKPRTAAAEAIQVGRTEADAKRVYQRLRTLYAGCADPRTQLLGVHRLTNVGDDAMLLVLRQSSLVKPQKAKRGGARPAKPVEPTLEPRTTVLGLARTGQVTTVTVSTVENDASARLQPNAAMLTAAVQSLCGAPGVGACTGKTSLERMAPPPVGSDPGMLTEVDLPSVNGVTDVWMGTRPGRATGPEANSPCDTANFAGAGVSRGRTRTFLIPDADLPDRFGLGQNVASMPVGRAQGLVTSVIDEIDACQDDNAAAEVTGIFSRDEGPVSIRAWRIDLEIQDDSTVPYLTGVVRNGTAVSQLTFVPAPGKELSEGAFPALLERAAERLTYLPKPQPAKAGNGGKQKGGQPGQGGQGSKPGKAQD